jgi:protein tyrosine phosphatase (PTP) superfamily phosphohydrolase (DUF442 family)
MSDKDSPDISQITDYLFISSQPQAKDVEAILSRNIRLVIAMRGDSRPPTVLAQDPLQLLWLHTYDTVLTPIPLKKLLHGVHTALPVIQKGGGILCYCAKGRHRSVAMGAAILISLGHSAGEAMNQIRQQRKVAHPQAPHIRRRIELFDEFWQQQNGASRPRRGRSHEIYSEFVTGGLSKMLWGFRPDKNKR